MSNTYYNEMKGSANDIRKKYNLTTARMLPSNIKKILKIEGVSHIQPFDGKSFKSIRGAYEMDKNAGPIVYVRDNLPPDPFVFTLCHELKHHLHDQGMLNLVCSNSNITKEIEIAAEIFAAELIYPESLFLIQIQEICPIKAKFKPEDLVNLKVNTKTTLSYQGLCKRLAYHGYSNENFLSSIQWRNKQLEIFPNPFIRKKRRITSH
jgi:Zn-dependent peptidase ImmA (M78 family)